MRRVNADKYEQKRRDILDAAKQCFIKFGFAKASISEICRAAKISPGHLYHYFDNKEAIVEASAAAALQEGTDSFRKLVEASNTVVALNAVIENAKASQVRRDFSLLMEVVLAAERSPRLQRILKQHSRRMRVTLADFISQGQSTGIIDPQFDAQTTATILFSLLDGIRMTLARDPSVDLSSLREQLKAFMIRLLPARNAAVNEGSS